MSDKRWIIFFILAVLAINAGVTVYITQERQRKRANIEEGFRPGHYVQDENGIVKTYFYRGGGKECLVFSGTSMERPKILSIQAVCE